MLKGRHEDTEGVRLAWRRWECECGGGRRWSLSVVVLVWVKPIPRGLAGVKVPFVDDDE
jgi:hypothetical protein